MKYGKFKLSIFCVLLVFAALSMVFAGVTYDDGVIQNTNTSATSMSVAPKTDSVCTLGTDEKRFSILFVDSVTGMAQTVEHADGTTPTVTNAKSCLVFTNTLMAASCVVLLPTPTTGTMVTLIDSQTGAGADMWASCPLGVSMGLHTSNSVKLVCTADSNIGILTLMATSAGKYIIWNSSPGELWTSHSQHLSYPN